MRKMEKLNRGLVTARTAEGMYLTWRYLGNEPDGIAWRIYRKRKQGAWERLTDLLPRDVAPESQYDGNPGIVKKNTTPCCYVDPEGQMGDVYAVAPVTDGVEGAREETSLPVLESLPGAEGQAFRAAVHRIPMCPPPERVPLAHFTYRGVSVGPGVGVSVGSGVGVGVVFFPFPFKWISPVQVSETLTFLISCIQARRSCPESLLPLRTSSS